MTSIHLPSWYPYSSVLRFAKPPILGGSSPQETVVPLCMSHFDRPEIATMNKLIAQTPGSQSVRSQQCTTEDKESGKAILWVADKCDLLTLDERTSMASDSRHIRIAIKRIVNVSERALRGINNVTVVGGFPAAQHVVRCVLDILKVIDKMAVTFVNASHISMTRKVLDSLASLNETMHPSAGGIDMQAFSRQVHETKLSAATLEGALDGCKGTRGTPERVWISPLMTVSMVVSVFQTMRALELILKSADEAHPEWNRIVLNVQATVNRWKDCLGLRVQGGDIALEEPCVDAATYLENEPLEGNDDPHSMFEQKSLAGDNVPLILKWLHNDADGFEQQTLEDDPFSLSSTLRVTKTQNETKDDGTRSTLSDVVKKLSEQNVKTQAIEKSCTQRIQRTRQTLDGSVVMERKLGGVGLPRQQEMGPQERDKAKLFLGSLDLGFTDKDVDNWLLVPPSIRHKLQGSNTDDVFPMGLIESDMSATANRRDSVLRSTGEYERRFTESEIQHTNQLNKEKERAEKKLEESRRHAQRTMTREQKLVLKRAQGARAYDSLLRDQTPLPNVKTNANGVLSFRLERAAAAACPIMPGPKMVQSPGSPPMRQSSVSKKGNKTTTSPTFALGRDWDLGDFDNRIQTMVDVGGKGLMEATRIVLEKDPLAHVPESFKSILLEEYNGGNDILHNVCAVCRESIHGIELIHKSNFPYCPKGHEGNVHQGCWNSYSQTHTSCPLCVKLDDVAKPPSDSAMQEMLREIKLLRKGVESTTSFDQQWGGISSVWKGAKNLVGLGGGGTPSDKGEPPNTNINIQTTSVAQDKQTDRQEQPNQQTNNQQANNQQANNQQANNQQANNQQANNQQQTNKQANNQQAQTNNQQQQPNTPVAPTRALSPPPPSNLVSTLQPLSVEPTVALPSKGVLYQTDEKDAVSEAVEWMSRCGWGEVASTVTLSHTDMETLAVVTFLCIRFGSSWTRTFYDLSALQKCKV
jgi:hypothetical protein